MVESAGQAVPPPPGDHVLLLVWDAPNIDMGLGSFVGGRPDSANRPRFGVIGQWLLDEADRLSDKLGCTVVPEATVFTNVNPKAPKQIQAWVDALRNIGFAVFAKPKLSDDCDVDPDMLAHIKARHDENVLAGLVVASADGQNFDDPITVLSGSMPVTVLGFRELASWAVSSSALKFIDLEDIDGVFRQPLPRISLENLPDTGGWLPPFRPLSCLHSD